MTRGNCAVDCHLHTAYSGHGSGTVDEVVRSALEKGLATVAFTEHLTLPESMDPDRTDSMSPDDAWSYHDDVMEARRKYPEIAIVYGAEVDWIGDEGFTRELCGGYDYLLGSVHFLDGWGFDNPDLIDGWAEWGVDEVWRRYLELWEDAVRSSIPFTCMAHPDLPKVFGLYPSFVLSEYYAEMAACARDYGRAIEVNTAGLRKPAGEAYPSFELLKTCCDMGIACSVGSDAHSPSLVGQDVDAALTLMSRAGYSEVLVPLPGGGIDAVPLVAS